MKTKSVKFKHFFQGTWGCMISLPKAWMEEMGWEKNTPLVLEYHAYKKEIVIMEDYRKLAPIRVPKVKKGLEGNPADIDSEIETEIEVDDEEEDSD